MKEVTEYTVELIELGKAGYLWNGGTKCDVGHGPCACGAWHSASEDERRVLRGRLRKSAAEDMPVKQTFHLIQGGKA